jgi:hypothetical protein
MGEGTSALEQEQRGSPVFAATVLLAALRAPGASSSAAAARTIAGLIGLLAAEGADEEVAAILAPRPEGTATFDVNAVGASVGAGPGDGGGTANSFPPELIGLDIGRALREASRLAQGHAELISVVAVGPDGVRRRVLERKGGAPFRFLFPNDDTFDGNPDGCAAAVDSWRHFLGGPSPIPSASDDTGDRQLTPAHPGPIGLVDHVLRAPASDRLEPAPGLPAVALDTEALTETIRDALSDITVEVDMGAIEHVVDGALRAALATSRVREAPAPQEPPGGWVTHAALVGAAEELHVLMEAFNDRIRSGSRSLEVLADELSSRDRTAAAFTDALSRSINASIDRMLRHIDDRLDELPTRRTAAPSDKRAPNKGTPEKVNPDK